MHSSLPGELARSDGGRLEQVAKHLPKKVVTSGKNPPFQVMGFLGLQGCVCVVAVIVKGRPPKFFSLDLENIAS